MIRHDFMLSEVVLLLRRIDAAQRDINPATLVFTELDFDSLQMLDLIEALKARYGVDLLSPPCSFEDLRTPRTIAAALARCAAPPV